MLQEIGLYEDLSITETFAFYGRLYGMTRVDVNSRRDFLVKLFGLQVNSICVGKMRWQTNYSEKTLYTIVTTLQLWQSNHLKVHQANSINFVFRLSRADKSLFGLAVTLLHHPQIIVLDEPFAFMDPIMKSMWESFDTEFTPLNTIFHTQFSPRVLQSISKMTSEENVTFVIATRSVEDAATSNMVYNNI